MSEQGSSAQEEAIVGAVYALFGDEGFQRATTGELRAFYERLASLDAPLMPTTEREAEIHKVALLSAGLGEAQVGLSATRVFKGEWQGRVWTETFRYGGPVSLVLVGTEWKVADVFRDGRSLRQSLFRVDLAGRAGEAQITAGQGRFLSDSHLMLIAIATNVGSEPLQISTVLLGSRSGRRTVWREALVSVRELPPGQTAFELQAEVVASAKPSELRLLFRTDRGLVDVRPDAAAAITHMPVLVRRLTTWSLLSLATVVALVVAVGVATNVAGATVMLLAAAGVYSRQLASAARKRFRRPSARPVRALIALFAVAVILSVSGGAHYLANQDWSSSPPDDIFWPVLAIGFVGIVTLLRLPKRWSRRRALIQLISMTAILGGLALLIGYGAPISVAQVAAQKQRLGRIALNALRTGNTTKLRQVTYPGYQQSVTGYLGLYRIATHLYTLRVVGQPTISKGQIQYRLGVRNGAGGFRLTVHTVERNRQLRIWKLILTGKAHKTIKLS